MAFNTFVLDQLNNPPEELAIEILKILNATSYALPCAEIFKLSKEAVTSRDISLEMSQTLKPKGLVEIDRKERKPGVGSDIAFWKITQAGKDFLQSTNTKLPADITPNYDPPIFGQTPAVDTVVAEIEKVIDTPAAVTDAPASPDYSDKPKAYQMLKYIEAHPGCTNREIMLALNMDPYIEINAYIKPYSDFVRIDNPAQGPRVFTLTIPVDSFYVDKRKAVPKQPGAKDEATPIPQQPQETTATDTVDAQGHEVESSGFAADQASQTFTDSRENEIHQTQIKHDRPAAKVRFAITSDRHMILMGLAAEDIELTESDSKELISFCKGVNFSNTLFNKPAIKE